MFPQQTILWWDIISFKLISTFWCTRLDLVIFFVLHLYQKVWINHFTNKTLCLRLPISTLLFWRDTFLTTQHSLQISSSLFDPKSFKILVSGVFKQIFTLKSPEHHHKQLHVLQWQQQRQRQWLQRGDVREIQLRAQRDVHQCLFHHYLRLLPTLLYITSISGELIKCGPCLKETYWWNQ